MNPKTIDKTPRAALDVGTSEYQIEHGRLPRGTGNWAFFDSRDAKLSDRTDRAFWFNGKYGDAVRAAKRHFAARGGNINITVGS